MNLRARAVMFVWLTLLSQEQKSYLSLVLLLKGSFLGPLPFFYLHKIYQFHAEFLYEYIV